ncbi:hypothetical protein HR060_17175 [Catenovulum sp. SM1970]|uniref:hypothetical protein n=1 Tax=Marinifaba aquimaris TaxID=2741323 RepID=UPI001571A41D|nr:hypothetical protein [Marinifaba aquimaris]NTS78578.1 hypothetical protein [Marinifaba aquimaris]
MFNKFLNLTLVHYIWRRYKTRIVSTVVFVGFCLLVNLLHQDYIQYSQLHSEKSDLGLSFIFKWGTLVLGFVVYCYLNRATHAKQNYQKNENKGKQTENRMKLDDCEQQNHQKPDPFSALRTKEKLRSKADLLIDKQKTKKD